MSQTLEHEQVEGEQPEPTQGAPARRGPLGWPRRQQLVAAGGVLAVLVATGGAFAAGRASVDAKVTPEYQALELANSSMGARLTVMSQRNTALLDQVGAVSRKASELQTREIAVDAREKAVGRTEKAVQDAQIAGSGTYVVGEDVKAGTYRSEDNDGCYYAFMTSTSADADIRSNNLGDGLMRVTLRDGDVFESSRCNLWKPA